MPQIYLSMPNDIVLKKLTFSSVTFAELSSLVNLSEEIDDSKFTNWLSESAELDQDSKEFLQSLAQRHRKNIDAYSEEEVKAKLIIPILNRVDLTINGFTDWYERPLHGVFGDTELYGTADYVVARGEKEPLAPYFFLQEFKPAFTNKSPEVQLVSAMLVALQGSNRVEMKGAYINGSIWKFVLMECLQDKFIYYVSHSLDCLRASDAATIYVALEKLKQQLASLP